MSEVARREGMTFIAEIPAGAKFRLMPDGSILVAHPDMPLIQIHSDGTKTEVRP